MGCSTYRTYILFKSRSISWQSSVPGISTALIFLWCNEWSTCYFLIKRHWWGFIQSWIYYIVWKYNHLCWVKNMHTAILMFVLWLNSLPFFLTEEVKFKTFYRQRLVFSAQSTYSRWGSSLDFGEAIPKPLMCVWDHCSAWYTHLRTRPNFLADDFWFSWRIWRIHFL